VVDFNKYVKIQLEKVLSLKHILYEKEAVAVARRRKDNADVIFFD